MTEYQILKLIMQGRIIGESVDPTAAIIWSIDKLGK
jgi:hypothetical protein